MLKISSGIKDLDVLIDFFYEGDNVVWEVEAGTSVETFVKKFLQQALDDDKDLIFVSFNNSPQSLLKKLGGLAQHQRFILLDAFTSGKGKDDRTFLKFYKKRKSTVPHVIKIEKPSDIESFTEVLNSIEDSVRSSARYVFDSLTGMQDLWNDEQSTFRFFTYMCPRLYDLDTVAYWLLEKDAHSQAFKANLRHITQVVIDLHKRGEKLFLKTLKLDNRTSREAFKAHKYEIDGSDVTITTSRREPLFNLGNKLKAHRIRRGISQKDLADKIGLTPSFISQMENNQISPSLNSFMQICGALDISPVSVWEDKALPPERILRKHEILASVKKGENDLLTIPVMNGEKISSFFALIAPRSKTHGHFLYHKGEELIHVLSGRVSMVVDGKRTDLEAGDTIFLTDMFPVLWSNEMDVEVELLIVCSQ